MGMMFLHHWEPNRPADDPQHGFSVVGNRLQPVLAEMATRPDVAQPGFHAPAEGLPYMTFRGGWEIEPGFGADMSQMTDAENAVNPDQIRFVFEGTDVGIRVRRANYRARLNILIDGEPANLLPL